MTQNRMHIFLPTEPNLSWQTDAKPIAASNTLVWSGHDENNTDGTLKRLYALLVELPEGGMAVRSVEHIAPASRLSYNDRYNTEEVRMCDQPVASEEEGRALLRGFSITNDGIVAVQEEQRAQNVASATTKEFKRRAQQEGMPYFIAAKTHHFGQDIPVVHANALTTSMGADNDNLAHEAA